MKANSGYPGNTPQTPTTLWRKFFHRPTTRSGWWSFSLAALFVVLMLINGFIFMRMPQQVGWRQALLPFYGIGMLLVGLSSGAVALVAVIKEKERSWLVWLPFFAGFVVVFLLVGEILFPH